jgi:low affinity Fe/Cu permease
VSLWERLPSLTANIAGSPWVLPFSVAAFCSGVLFGWSDKWWLTVDRIVYLLSLWLLFLLQGAQNRDTKAIQVKLDEIIKSLPGSNRAVDIEHGTEHDIDELKEQRNI